jgi:phosphoenolpyruvate synthase/pyruvate phosphate dikinase
MKYAMVLEEISEKDRAFSGGKATALGKLSAHRIPIPRGICITKGAYHAFTTVTGIHERIQGELNRKDFNDMRWEELWDASLRIRNTASPA